MPFPHFLFLRRARPLRAFVCLLNIPTYLSFAIRFPMSPGLLPRFAHHPYPCLLFICRLTIYLPLACRTAHLLPRPWYRARPFAVTLLRRLPCVFTSFPPSSTRSPSCLPPATRRSRLLLFAAALVRSHTCPRPLVPVLLPDGGVLFPLCALPPWRIIVKIIINHSSRFLAPAMLFYALFFTLVALEHDGLNRASAVKRRKILQKFVKTEKEGDFSI